MAARRLILAMLFLLVLSSIIVALIPIEQPGQNEDSSTTSTSSTTATAAATGEGKLIVRRVSADAPKPARIRMHVGDQLQLTITSSVPNQVEIEALGEYENVDPNFPARLDVFPFDTGRFPVRLLDPPGQVATIVVEP